MRLILDDFTGDSLAVFFPKLDSTNSEGMLTTADVISPLVELIGVAELHCAGSMMKMDSMGNYRNLWVILNMVSRSPQIHGWVRENRRSRWKAAE